MESMRRQLSTSLPRQRNEADLLSEFKAAALSVTNLYKTAATSQTRARAAGFQDALDDLLAFLDQENIGLMDGEGWRIRQWATERLDMDGSLPRQNAGPAHTSTDDEDGSIATREEERYEERSSSPDGQRKPPSTSTSGNEINDIDTARPRRVESEPPQSQAPSAPRSQDYPAHTDFTFRSTQAYPSNHDRESPAISMDLDKSAAAPPIFTSLPPASHGETVRILPRATRSGRLAAHSRRSEARSPALNLNLGAGAGNKRKLPYSDFFDISGFQDGTERKDANGPGWGGKRGRHA